MTHEEKENWINNRWRPMMGWMYFVVCITDFIIFPVLWAIFKASIGEPVTPWEPLTLQGAGLFHVAMGAILGVTAWSRGREKMMGVAGDSQYVYEKETYQRAPENNRPIERNDNTTRSTGTLPRPSQPPEPLL